MEGIFNQSRAQVDEMDEKSGNLEGAYNDAMAAHTLDAETLGRMENAFGEANKQVDEEILRETSAHNAKLQAIWKKMIDAHDSDDPGLMDRLNEEWLQAMDGEMTEEKFAEHWQTATDIEEMQYLNMKKAYTFASGNDLTKHPAVHREFINIILKGNTHKAIKAIEAHLMKHPKDHAAWTMLGGLLQETDNDQQSVAAMQEALKIKPDCLTANLHLGVGCTNILDEAHSMMYLHRWLTLNPKYSAFAGQELLSEARFALGDFETEELIGISRILVERFEAARNQGGFNDPDFCIAFGVIAFCAREYKLAVDMMTRVTEIDPNNYSAWNKMGACLAQLNEKGMAQMAYRRALDLKPNYIRPWVNLGLSHASEVNVW